MATPTAKAEDRIRAGLLAAYGIHCNWTAALREVGDRGWDVSAIGKHRVVCAELGGNGERLEVSIHRDHPGTQRTGDHDHAQPHTAGTDHGHPLPLGDARTADQRAV